MRKVTRAILGAAALLVACGLGPATSPAEAQEKAETRQRVGVVQEIDLVRSTLTMGGRTFKVTPSTVLEGRRGERITLDQIKPVGDQNPYVVGKTADAVGIEAVKVGSDLVLVHLKVLADVPR